MDPQAVLANLSAGRGASADFLKDMNLKRRMAAAARRARLGRLGGLGGLVTPRTVLGWVRAWNLWAHYFAPSLVRRPSTVAHPVQSIPSTGVGASGAQARYQHNSCSNSRSSRRRSLNVILQRMSYASPRRCACEHVVCSWVRSLRPQEWALTHAKPSPQPTMRRLLIGPSLLVP